jgi:Right handed beta helix region
MLGPENTIDSLTHTDAYWLYRSYRFMKTPALVFVLLTSLQLSAMKISAAPQPALSASSNRTMRTRPPLVITVGTDAGDFRGNDDKIIQAAIEYVHRVGGGTIRLQPGTYTLHNSVFMRPNITIEGAGEKTVLQKAPSVVTDIVRDVDWYEQAVEVKDARGFAPGFGIMLRAGTNKPDWDISVLRATVLAVSGNTVYFDRLPVKDFWVEKGATAGSIFPLIAADHVDNVRLSNLVLDGAREQNAHINGNFSGAVLLEFCNHWTFENVVARNYNGDGFSIQVCDDPHFVNCQAINNADLGFHPGSGTQRPVFENCIARGNQQGLYFCWGVSDGKAENCTLSENTLYGVSIGHRDTDNLVKDCTIERNGEVGVLFRNEGGEFRNGHRNRIEDCVIRDTGAGAEKPGTGIDIQGRTDDIVLANLTIEDTGAGHQKTGIRIGKDAQRIHVENDTIRGSVTKIEDLRPVSSR